MMIALFWLINLAALIVVYILWIRPILRKTPALEALFIREDTYFGALRAKFAGIKQRLTAGMLYFSGVVVTVHDYVAPKMTGVDVTPFFPKIVAAIPPSSWPLILIGFTAILDYFRYLADKRRSE